MAPTTDSAPAHAAAAAAVSRLANVRCAIVTGSSSGIGRAIALGLAENGVGLVVCADLQAAPGNASGAAGVTGDDALLATHLVIAKRHGSGRAVFVRCDVSTEQANGSKGDPVATEGEPGETVWGMADLVEEAAKRAGRVDVMVNNAGIGILDIATHEMDLATWNRSLNVNATGPFLGSKHAIRQFLKQDHDEAGIRGSIVNMSSIGGAVGLYKCSAYCACKAAVIGLTREIALEYGGEGIRCNAVLPGYVETPMLLPFVEASPEFAGYLKSSVPAGRLAKPMDIAGAVMWLSSTKESSYVSGITLPVDGGFTAR